MPTFYDAPPLIGGASGHVKRSSRVTELGPYVPELPAFALTLGFPPSNSCRHLERPLCCFEAGGATGVRPVRVVRDLRYQTRPRPSARRCSPRCQTLSHFACSGPDAPDGCYT